jgi:hypothetical protein
MLVVCLVCNRKLEFLGTKSLTSFDWAMLQNWLMLGIYYNRPEFSSKL